VERAHVMGAAIICGFILALVAVVLVLARLGKFARVNIRAGVPKVLDFHIEIENPPPPPSLPLS
jgi:hypothetical protein